MNLWAAKFGIFLINLTRHWSQRTRTRVAYALSDLVWCLAGSRRNVTLHQPAGVLSRDVGCRARVAWVALLSAAWVVQRSIIRCFGMRTARASSVTSG